MPLLDIATSQPSLQNRLGSIRIYQKVLSISFKFADENRLLPIGKSSQFPKRFNFQRKSALQIKAVASLEPKCLEHNENGQKSDRNAKPGADLDTPVAQVGSPREEWMALDERERLRRERISKAKKGRPPWNIGRKHSPETIARIRERTKIAMQDPKVKSKLSNLGHAQSEETRKKISLGVRTGWRKRRKKSMLQETCYFEWENLIAEASRTGYAGEEELQWDSYSVISGALALEWVEIIEERKRMRKGAKRGPKAPEHRRKIAEAIAAKWADSEYRQKVLSGISRFHGERAGVSEKKPRRKPSGVQSVRRAPVRKRVGEIDNSSNSVIPASTTRMRFRKSKAPSYEDPFASSKFKMIKGIKSQRAATEAKRTETVEKARLLIAEAEKATKALEVLAITSLVARASLEESRKLLAEATRLIESVDMGSNMVKGTEAQSTLSSPELISPVDKNTDIGNGGLDHTELRGSNGSSFLASSNDQDLNFVNLTLNGIINGGQHELLSSSSGRHDFSPFSLESLAKHSSSSSNHLDKWEINGNVKHENNPLPNGSKPQHTPQPPKSVAPTKRWVRGKLVEVTEEV